MRFWYFWANLVLRGLPWWLSCKESARQCRRRGLDPWLRKIRWRRKWQPTPVFLPGEFHGQRGLAGYSPWGRKNWTHLATKQQQRVLLLLLLLLSRSSRVRLCATPETAAHQAPRPWDSPGKNTAVGCHFLLQCMKGKSEREVAQSCLTPATPWTTAYQAPLSMGFSRQKYWSGVPLPSPNRG